MESETTQAAAALAAAQAHAARLAVESRFYRAGIVDEDLVATLAAGLAGADEAKISKMIESVKPKAAPPAAPVVSLPAPGQVTETLPTDPLLRMHALADRMAKG